MPDPLITQLHHILDLEKQALISADFEPLVALMQQKEEILIALAKTKVAAVRLHPIRAQMDENQVLLAAAIKGVAAAVERLDALQKVQNRLSIYDPAGRKDLVQNHRHSLEKKA